MTEVYRAYSPSRNEATTVTEDRATSERYVDDLNGASQQLGSPADWVVQEGYVEWGGGPDDTALDAVAEIIAGHVDHYIGVEPDQPDNAARALSEAGYLRRVPRT